MSATVLCIHEDRALARQHADALEAEGFGVLVAFDGRTTLELVRGHRPDFVVLDTYLPRQDGFEILAEIRTLEAMRDVPALLLSDGDVTEEVRARGRALGAVGVAPAPIAVDELVARVCAHVKPGAPGAMQMPSDGSLREWPIPELMHRLRLERSNGVLVLEHGKKRKALELRDGWPVAVRSNLVSECLGPWLVRAGRVSQGDLDESVVRMRSTGGLQGEILIAMDALDEDALVEALREHAQDKYFELYAWRNGQFELRRGAQLQRGSSLGLEGHPAELIVEGVRRRFPLKQIDRYIECHANEYLVPIEAGEEQLAEVGLTDEERAWIAGLDGSMTMGALVASAEWIRRLVFALVSIEFLAVAADAGDAREARRIAARVGAAASPPSAEDEESVRAELAELANRVRNKDHYGVLDVATTAGDEEIRLAYTCLAKRTHPDRFHGSSSSVRQLAAQVFERVAEAYAALSTAEARQRYAAAVVRGRELEAVEDEGRRALAAETAFQRGEAKLAARDYEGALLCFGQSMEHFPSEGEYRAHYGWCLYLCHPDNDVMLGEALEHCREGLKLAKDREKPYLLLGRLYKAMGKTGAAKKMFSRAVEIRPECVEAMRELRIMNMRREKTQGLGKNVLKKFFRR